MSFVLGLATTALFAAVPATGILAAVAAPLQANAATESTQQPERWRATLDTPDGELPFIIEIYPAPQDRELAFILNGEERVAVPEFSRADGSWRLSMPHYDSTIEAEPLLDDDSRVSGTWSKVRGSGNVAQVAFRAELGDRSRFQPRVSADSNNSAASDSTDFRGRWQVDFESSDDPAVAIIAGESSEELRATFLTTTGDYRYLAGRSDGNELRLSCFDGAHAFLFRATLDADGQLAGTFRSGNWWSESWSAERDPNASLPAGFDAVATTNTWSLPVLDFTDIDGNEVWLGGPYFTGKPLVVQIFGSWCPNCHDEADFLRTLSNRYKSKGVAFAGLAFELTDDFERNAEQVRLYARRWGLEYPMLLAGTANKQRAAEALGMVDRVLAFPTLLFIDGHGKVQSIHSGFAGPATGVEHERVRAEIEARIQELLTPVEQTPAANGSSWIEVGGDDPSSRLPEDFELPLLGGPLESASTNTPRWLRRGPALELESRRYFQDVESGTWIDVDDLAHRFVPAAAVFDPNNGVSTARLAKRVGESPPHVAAAALAELRRRHNAAKANESHESLAQDLSDIAASLTTSLQSAYGPLRREALLTARDLYSGASIPTDVRDALNTLATADWLQSLRLAAKQVLDDSLQPTSE